MASDSDEEDGSQEEEGSDAGSDDSSGSAVCVEPRVCAKHTCDRFCGDSVIISGVHQT